MSVPVIRKPFVSIEDYLAGEERSDVRHEYLDGDVYAMTGASRTHGLIVNAIAFALTPAARRKGCQLFTSDMKLRVEMLGKTLFYYPDLLLTCNPADNAPRFSRSPCLLIEVLSESTARVDHREKLFAYLTLPSLKNYLLVEQATQHVELYRRTDDWHAKEFDHGDIPLDCLDTVLPMAEIYRDVVWDQPAK